MDCESFEFNRQVDFGKIIDQEWARESFAFVFFTTVPNGSLATRFPESPGIYPPERSLYGEDALQSFILCLRLLKMLFEESEGNGGYSVWWIDPGDCGGLESIVWKA